MYKYNFKTNKYEAHYEEEQSEGYDSDGSDVGFPRTSMAEMLARLSKSSTKKKAVVVDSDDNDDTFSWLPKSSTSKQCAVEPDVTEVDDAPKGWTPVKKWWLVRVVKQIYSICGIYVLWILLHYASVKLYSRYCVPSSLFGILLTPFLVPTPHCKALRWTMQQGGATIDSIWIVMGTWLASKLVVMTKKA